MSGLELMRALVAGEIPKPPIAHTLGFDLVVMTQDLRLNHRMHTQTGLRSRTAP